MNLRFLNELRDIKINKWLGLLFLVPMMAFAAEGIDKSKKESDVNAPLNNPLIYDRTVQGEMDEVYKKVFTGLGNNSYFVIFEPNLGKNLSHYAKRWTDDYNKNKLNSIRSIVFCNAWYANKISNIDPSLLALCPLHITLYSKNKETHILFVRPGRVAGNSPAQDVAKEMEDDIIRTIEVAIAN